MQSLPHSQFNVVVVKIWSKVDRAEDSFVLLQFPTLSKPNDVNYRSVYILLICSSACWAVCYLGAIDPYFCKQKTDDQSAIFCEILLV